MGTLAAFRSKADALTLSLLLVWTLGPTIYLTSLLIAPPPADRQTAAIAVPLACYVFAGWMALTLVFRRSLPAFTLHLANVAACSAVTAVIWIDGTPSSPYDLFYMWPVLQVAYFMRWRPVIAHVAIASGFYAGVLLSLPGGSLTAGWYILSASMLFICLLVSVLHEQLSWLAAVVRSSQDAIITIGSDGNIRSWNDGAKRLFGIDSTAIVGRSVESLFPADDEGNDNPILVNVVRARELGAVAPFETTQVTRDGRSVDISVTLSVLSEPLGQPVGISAIMHDISERKRLEVGLLQSQKRESIGRLAAGIAHEINTPIQFIGDNIDFIGDAANALLTGEQAVDRPFLESEVPLAVSQARAGVHRIADIVWAMKAFDSADSSRRSPVDLNEAVQVALTVASGEYSEVAQVQMQLGTVPLFSGFASDINRCLVEVIVNASQAIESEGNEGLGLITVATFARNQEAVVTIGDNGPGISPDIAHRIFDPFFTTRPVGKRRGQGLTLAHSIVVDQHGGSLTFESTPRKGTTFVICFPVS